MTHENSREVLLLVLALLGGAPAAVAAPFTYYDCRNADGSMSYRIFPCDKRQQEVRRQEGEQGAQVPAPGTASIQAEALPSADGSAQEDFAAAEAARRLGKYVDAATRYRRAAELGYAPAQYALGALFEKGDGVAQDYPQAAVWYRKAAEQGMVAAQFSMGVMYDIGQGVAQDYRQAMLWYGRAAERGDAKAQNNLGFMYSQGKGVAQDYVTAHMWFNISGARGYAEGRRNREFVEKLMTPEEVASAQRLAAAWMAMHP